MKETILNKLKAFSELEHVHVVSNIAVFVLAAIYASLEVTGTAGYDQILTVGLVCFIAWVVSMIVFRFKPLLRAHRVNKVARHFIFAFMWSLATLPVFLVALVGSDSYFILGLAGFLMTVVLVTFLGLKGFKESIIWKNGVRYFVILLLLGLIYLVSQEFMRTY